MRWRWCQWAERKMSCMCMCIYSDCGLFSRRVQAGVVACGEVWEATGCGCGGCGRVEGWSGVLVWLAGWHRPSLPLCLSSSLLLPPRNLLLAETGLDQASNMAHARMDEAKLCRDCLSDENCHDSGRILDRSLVSSAALTYFTLYVFTMSSLLFQKSPL